VTIAQVHNLADLGYFCDQLAEAGVEPRARDFDHYDMMHGVSRRVYFVQVRQDVAEYAADRMQQLVQATADQSESDADEWNLALNEHSALAAAGDAARQERHHSATVEHATSPTGRVPVGLAPIALALVAGGLAAWAARDSLDARGPVPTTTSSSLWKALEAPDQWMESPATAGTTQRRFQFDSRRRSLVVEQDFDGDGWYDSRREFLEQAHALFD
jgi:hypothetical protein